MKDVKLKKVNKGWPFQKIFLNRDEIREIRNGYILFPGGIDGWPIHTYYAKYRFLAFLAPVGYVLILTAAAVAGVPLHEALKAILLIGAAGGMLLGLYAAFKECVLRTKLSRDGRYTDTVFWISALERRKLL
jgi:hypothetical protein